jgi:hypothetical protein
MINRAPEILNKNRIAISKSSNNCFRLVGSTLLKGDPNSTTISKKKVIELDSSLLEDECSFQELKDAIEPKILNGEFTEEEITILNEGGLS